MVIRIDKRSGSLVVPLGEDNIAGKLSSVLARFDPCNSGDQLWLTRFGFTADDMIALVEWLKGSPCRRLALDMNGVRAQSCSLFRDLLRRSDCSLKFFSLARNPIGVGAIDIFDGLAKNEKLLTLDLSYCDITEEIISSCMPNIIANDSLIVINLIGNDITDETICKVLAKTAQNRLKYEAVKRETSRESAVMLREETLARQRQMTMATLELKETLIEMRAIQRMNKLEQHWVSCHAQEQRAELEAINKVVQQASDGKKGKKKGKKAKK